MVEETQFKIFGRREIRPVLSLFVNFFMFYSHTLFLLKHLDLLFGISFNRFRCFCACACRCQPWLGSGSFMLGCSAVAYCLELQTAFRGFFSMSRCYMVVLVSFAFKPIDSHHLRFSTSTSCQ